jgi:hypothetical protein
LQHPGETTFHHFLPLFATACVVAENTLRLLRCYSAAFTVIPPTRNAGGITQARAAPWRNNFSTLVATFRHCLLVGEKHIGAAGVLFRRLHGNSADRKRRRNNASACSTPAKQLFTTFYSFSSLPAFWQKTRWRYCGVTPAPSGYFQLLALLCLRFRSADYRDDGGVTSQPRHHFFCATKQAVVKSCKKW